MKISLEENFNQPLVLCLGFFDCMHVGHVELLRHAKLLSESSAKIGLFTFQNNHFEVLKRPTKLIYTFDERVDVYKKLGVDVVVSARFDDDFRAMSGNEFLKKISKFNLKGVVCGKDFTCGSDLVGADGVQSFFRDICPVSVVDLVQQGGRKICSSYIRELLSENKIEQANGFLSEPFFFEGVVEHGRNVGHVLGFPTINLPIPAEKIAPQGVYGGTVCVQGKKYDAVINVGNMPTFDCEAKKVEAHLLNFDGNLYGEKVKISLTKYLRAIKKFENTSELSEQLKKDIEAVKND